MEENPRKKLKADLSDVASVEGYISKVSAAKISKNGTHYLNAVIQISDENISDELIRCQAPVCCYWCTLGSVVYIYPCLEIQLNNSNCVYLKYSKYVHHG